MNRARLIASLLVVALLLPASAEAAATETGASDRVPFPPASAAAPTLLRLTVNADTAGSKAWCRSEIVIGGFCVVN